MDNKKDNKKRINLSKKTIALIAIAAILLICLIIALATCKSKPSNNGGDIEQTSGNQQTSGDSSNAIHKHTVAKVNEKAATCDKSGNIEFWFCTDCGQYFYDSQCNNEITDKNLVEVSPLGHTFNEYTWGSDANSGHGGVCSVCRLEVDFEPHTFDDEANCKCGYEFPYDEYIKFTLLNDGTYEAKASTTNLPPYIAIPAIYGKKPVSSISSSGFEFCTSITSITIPDSVTNIGSYAFQYCRGLTTLTIGNSVTSIGDGAFYGCEMLITLTMGNSVVSIGDSAFTGCIRLMNITIPDSVTSVGQDAFKNCSNINYNSYDKGLYLGNKENPYVVLIKANSTRITSCQIHDDTKIVYSNAFSKCSSLESIIIPSNIIDIGTSAFSGCSALTSITIPNSVTNIGESAFSGCTELTEASIPNSMTTIRSYTFSNCFGLKNVIIPDSVISIDSEAFLNCSGLTEITVPDSVTSIGKKAFSGCKSLSEITLPFVGNTMDDSSSVGLGYIFEGGSSWNGTSKIPGSLKKVTITKATSIGRDAFQGCSGLTSVVIPDSVTSIGYSAFSGCKSLTNITIPNSLTSIGVYAFESCTSLTSINIPDSVMSIGMYAFSGCSSLTNVEFENTSGWKAGNTDITVTDTAGNATYLTITYRDKEWTRS